jgi:hypothetical protein
VDYQIAAATCPKCGGSDQVQTARELFDTMNGAREQAFQRLNQFQQPGQGQYGQGQPGQGQYGNSGDDDYDHYNVEGSGSGSGSGRNFGRNSSRPDFDFDLDSGNVADDIGGAIFGVALGFAGRAIGKRMKRAFEEKVIPAMQARAAQSQQQWEQSKAEQDAIVARYPEIRCCTRDQIVFLDGGYRTAPFSELYTPATLAQADDVVSRLR